MVKVIVPGRLEDELRRRLATLDAPIELLVVDREGQGAAITDATAAVRWNLSDTGLRRVLDEAQRLRWLHSWSAGIDRWPTAELRERDIVLTNAAGVFAIPISEWVITALLMAVKYVHAMHDAQREGRWMSDIVPGELYGKQLLILGLGGIGREVARRAAAFGMRVWGMNRSGGAVEHVERIVTDDSWRTLLPDTDFLVVTLPLTPATRSIIGPAELALLKPTSWIVNVGRGATIDEAALLRTLQQGSIGGAAIDAWVEEPLPPGHPAWTTPNLIIWPHRSGTSPMNEQRGLDLFTENLRRFAHDQPLLNVVDLEAGY